MSLCKWAEGKGERLWLRVVRHVARCVATDGEQIYIYIYIYICVCVCVCVCKSLRVVAFALLHLTLTHARTRAFSSTRYEVSVERGVTHSLKVHFKYGDKNIIPLRY
jgi:hypothetical protein